MSEARYYDPETGGSTTEARDLCMDNVVHDSFAARELARLQRERDTERAAREKAERERDEARAEWEKCECGWHDELNAMAGDLSTERAAREKAEHDCGLWQDTVVEYEDILRRCEGIFSFLHFTPENEPSWDDLPDMIMELRARAETAESTLATLRAELRQARDCITGLLNGMKYWGSQEDGIPDEAWDAFATGHMILGWALAEQPTALKDAGLVEDDRA